MEKSKKKHPGILNEEDFKKKVEEIKARKQRREERKKSKRGDEERAAQTLRALALKSTKTIKRGFDVGDEVRIKGLGTKGRIASLEGKYAIVVIGNIKTNIPIKRLEIIDDGTVNTQLIDSEQAPSKMDELKTGLQKYTISHVTQNTINDHRKEFTQDKDIRGMRGDEAVLAVQRFVDDAILMGVSRVRILHGKGNGTLRQIVRTYLSSEPAVVHYADEHVQFGGAGITVVDLG